MVSQQARVLAISLTSTIALGIAWLATLAVTQWLFPASLTAGIVIISVLVSILTGVVSGFLPAWRAARMDPVEALRSE